MEPDRRGVDQKPLAQQTGPGKIQYVVMILIIIVVGIGSFIGGVQFEKGQKSSSMTAATGGYGAGISTGAGRAGFRMGGFGTVTAVSSSSITIAQRARGGMAGSTTSSDSDTTTSKTYAISSSTTVTDDGSTSAVSAIAVGDSVRIQTASTTSTAAVTIELNPTMGGSTAPSASN